MASYVAGSGLLRWLLPIDQFLRRQISYTPLNAIEYLPVNHLLSHSGDSIKINPPATDCDCPNEPYSCHLHGDQSPILAV